MRNGKDFVGTDRGITEALAGEFGALLQFPLWGQAMVVTYNVDGLDPHTDPYLVPSPLSPSTPHHSLALFVNTCH